jgi:hypothetical protein
MPIVSNSFRAILAVALMLAGCGQDQSGYLTRTQAQMHYVHQLLAGYCDEHEGQWPRTLNELREWLEKRGEPHGTEDLLSITDEHRSPIGEVLYTRPTPSSLPGDTVVSSPTINFLGHDYRIEVSKDGSETTRQLK